MPSTVYDHTSEVARHETSVIRRHTGGVPLALEVLIWAVLGSIGAFLAGVVILPIWLAFRSARRRDRSGSRNAPIVLSAVESLTIRNDPVVIALPPVTLLALIPLLGLTLWAVVAELAARSPGWGLAVLLGHALLLWRLAQIGTRIQRYIELSRIALVTHPVLGGRREVTWASIETVEEVTYIGPGVSGLYLRDSAGALVVLDRWLPRWEALREVVRQLTPHARWTRSRRGFLVG